MRSTAVLAVATLLIAFGCSPPERARNEVESPTTETRPPWVTGILDGQDSPDVQLELYDVQDLIYGLRDFPEASEPMQFLTGDDVANLIQHGIHPDQWEADVKTIVFQNGFLFVRNTSEVHRAIRAFLSFLREQLRVLHCVDLRVLETEAGAFSALPRCGVMTRGEMEELWTGRRDSVRAAGAVVAWDGQLVEFRSQGDLSIAAELRSLSSHPETLWIESRVEVRCADWRGEASSTIRIPDGGGAVVALGRDGDRLRYLVLRARTEGARRGRAVVLPSNLGTNVLALCELRDLLFPLRDFPRKARSSGFWGGATRAEVRESTIGMDQVVELVKETVQPGSWEGERTLEITPTWQLLVCHEPGAIADIERLLSRLNQFPGRSPVTLRMTILDVDPRAADRVLLCDPKDAAALESAWSTARVREDLSVSCLPTQTARVIGGGAWMEVRPVLDGEGKRCTMELQAECETGARWATTLNLPVGGAAVLPVSSTRVALLRCDVAR